MRVGPSAAIVAAMMMVGCGSAPTSINDLSSNVHISILGTPPVLTAPATVKAGVPFTASFTTVSGGCDATVDVLQQTTGPGNAITLIPLNQRASREPGRMCAPYVDANAPRTAQVAFLAAGTDTLRVEGFLPAPDGSLQLGTIEKIIQVTP